MTDAPPGTEHKLRREITAWGSFTWGYADVGADVYVALGLVLATAEGLANVAFLFAGLVYVTVGLAYTELSAAYPLAGGGQFFVLRGLGDFWGFIAGWAVLLDFTVDITLFAFSSAGYVNHFFPRLNQHPWIIIETAVLILFLYAVNVSGVKESTRLNSTAAIIDIFSETTLIFLGFVIAFSPSFWWSQVWSGVGGFTHFNLGNLALGASLAIISFVGLESIAQAAQETIRPSTVMPRTSVALILTILAYAIALSVLALGVVHWQTFNPSLSCHPPYHQLPNGSICQVHQNHENAPVPWLADNLPVVGIFIAPIVSLLGAMLLLISSNAGVYGSSRIAYSMASYNQLPGMFTRVGERRQNSGRSAFLLHRPGHDPVVAGRTLGLHAVHPWGYLCVWSGHELLPGLLCVPASALHRPVHSRGRSRCRGTSLFSSTAGPSKSPSSTFWASLAYSRF